MAPNVTKVPLESAATDLDASTTAAGISAVNNTADSKENDLEGKAVNIDAGALRSPVEASYVGWQQVGGWEEKDRLNESEDSLDTNTETLLDNILPDKLYGDWYHSVALYGIAGILSFIIGYFKFSFAPVFFVALITALLYRTSSKKYRNTLRDLIQKETTVQKIETDYESMEWLNNLLDKYWPLIEPKVSQDIVLQVNQILATNPAIPKFIKAIWIDQFTLGIKPPRIDHVKTLGNTNSNIVVMDWCVSFTPHDLCDMTAKQVRNYVNQRAVVKAKLFGLTIPVTVANISFKAETRLRFQLMTPSPHVETINVQLLSVPEFDFVANLFGSVFNWEILAIPGLYGLIRNMAAKYMGPILLPPFSLQLNIPQLLSKSDLSIGVLEIKVKSITGLKYSSGLLNKTCNPYLQFSNSVKVLGKTKVAKNGLDPVWNESIYLLVGSFTDPLSISIYDKREKLKDKRFGTLDFNINTLHDKPIAKNLKAHLLKNSKSIGELNFDLRFYPTLERKKLPDGTVEELPDLNTGISKIVIQKLRGIDEPGKNVSATVELYVNGKNVLTTKKVSGDGILEFNKNYELIISDRRKTRCRFIVKDSKGEILGSTVQMLNDLIDRTEIKKKWIPLRNGKGEVEINTFWRPVEIESDSNSISYNPPIGAVRIFINKATNLRNLEKVGMIDPYARVLVNGSTRGRTNEKPQTVNPIWNEAIYVSVTSPNQRITLECMDAETVGGDRSLGKFDLQIQDLFDKGSDDKYVEKIDDTPRSAKLLSKKGPKGDVTYYVSFYPAVPILSQEEVTDVDNIHERRVILEEQKTKVDEKEMSPEEKKRIELEEKEISEVENMYSNKMKLDLGELLQYNMGILAVTVLDGELPQPGCYVQTYFDSDGYPCSISPKISIRTIKTGWTGDTMIKELEWSVTTFRVVKKADANKADDFICEVEIPTIELVRNCYTKPSILNLFGHASAKIMVQVSWFPINVTKIPQSDLITNNGDLVITAKSAKNLIAADSNGFSDPYLKFYLNDNKNSFFKTSIQKKTLNPIWNQTLDRIEVCNRVNDYLRIEVMDYDVGVSNDVIGNAIVPLADIASSGVTSLEIPVKGVEKEDGGMLYLDFNFEPRYTTCVVKKSTNVGDLTSKGFNTGLNSGLKAGTAVVGAGVDTIGKFGGVFGRKKKNDNKEKTED